LKFLFVYFAMAYAIKYNKSDFLADFTKMLTGILLTSVIFVFSDYLLPNVLFTLAQDGRGLMGISPGSLFSSRVLYSGFLLLFSILLLSFKFDKEKGKYFIYKPSVYYGLLTLALILVILTFSRKELLLLLIVYGITFLYKSEGRARIFSVISVVVLTPAILYFLWMMLGDSIQGNFNEDYVRYKIFYYAVEIFEYYFPIGSGPGTYGTLMSKFYTGVYSYFEVDKAIIGYGSQIEGPIFDLFFVSLIAEYGVGFIFVLWFIFQPFFAKKDVSVKSVIHIGLLRFNLGIMLIGIGFMVPIMGNIVGLLLFFLLGIVTSRTSQSELKLQCKNV